MTGPAGELLAVGAVVKPFGIRGEVIVQPMTDFPERLCRARVLWLGTDASAVAETGVERAAASGSGIRMKLRGVEDRTAAEAARGKFLFVDEEHRAKLRRGEYFVHDVVGLAVRAEDGAALGEVRDVLRLPAGDVYVVRGECGEILIPAVRAFIRSVDMTSRAMTVRLIEGMTE